MLKAHCPHDVSLYSNKVATNCNGSTGLISSRGSRKTTACPTKLGNRVIGCFVSESQLREFESKLAQLWPVGQWRDVTVLLAVSGGADSVALLRGINALHTCGTGSVVVAHFNHRWRGEQSDADEAFVAKLCSHWDLPCEVGRADSERPVSGGGEGWESSARQKRYRFLEATAKKRGARYLVTAHTANDQVETILHRILRGTGIAGLSGISRARPLNEHTSLLRPLLSFRRDELVAYLDELEQPYREDASNLNQRFTRNRIRHDLLPRLQADYNEQVDESLLRLGSLAGEAQGVIDNLVRDLFARSVEIRNELVSIDGSVLSNVEPYLVRELFLAIWKERGWPQQAMGYEKWEELADLMLSLTTDSSTSKKIFPGGVCAEKQDGSLTLTRPEN